MDGETIITLLVVVVIVIWNLVVKIREKMGPAPSGPPFQWQPRRRNTKLEDLGPISILGEQTEHVQQIDVSQVRNDRMSETSRALRMGIERKVRQQPGEEESAEIKVLPTGRRQLQQAVVWSEILAPPLALRQDNDRQ